ncbi:MAG: hypothetical protein FD123_1312 [Bacteroidetes bacterium]|nr:MAG: hypothetical protein FD123_1312 [Bacteroidota bacterium]
MRHIALLILISCSMHAQTSFHSSTNSLRIKITGENAAQINNELNLHFWKRIFPGKELKRINAIEIEIEGKAGFPAEIQDWRWLGRLSITAPQLDKFPPEIFRLKNLEELDLEKTDIGELPVDLKRLEKLETLIIIETPLKGTLPELPDHLSCLQLISCGSAVNIASAYRCAGLGELMIENAGLSVLPGEIGNLKRLKKIELPGNKLEKLPAEIGNLKEVLLLNVSGNKISELPKELEQMTKLQMLNLENNKLEVLNIDFSKMPNLKEIFLSGNPMKKEEQLRIEKAAKNIKVHY